MYDSEPTAMNPSSANRTTASASKKKRVLLIDDHLILRQGVAQLINQEDDLMIAAEAENAQEGLEAIDMHKPDIVLVDISLPGMNGIEFIKNVKARSPALPIVVLSMHDESLYAERALRAGAQGYIMKKASFDEVLLALRKGLKGEFHVSGKVGMTMFQKFLGKPQQKNDSPVSILSDRELEVFELLGRGKSTREIAVALGLSVKTVDSHRAHIKDKLRLRSAAELIQHAVRFVETEIASQ